MNYKIYLFYLLFLFSTSNVAGQDKKIDYPVKNFELLWEAFDNHYAFFDLKNIKWEDSYKKYRRQVNDSTTNDSLFAICSRMLGELKDGHVGLSSKSSYFSAGEPANFLNNSVDSILKLIDVVDSDLVKLGFTDLIQVKGNVSGKNINILEISISSRFGYIRINSMYGISQSKLKSTLDQASKRFYSLEGVVIDVRFNGGGYDNYSYEIAGRFTDKKRIGHYKCVRKSSGHNDFTKLDTWYLKSKGKKQYIGPVIVLTSKISASAADVFALAMRQLPYVTIIGDTTYGVFSDVYESKLPNGWNYSLSNEKYFDVNMKCYEGIGITPDLLLQNSLNDLTQKRDPVIYKAIEVLNEKIINK